MSEKNNVDCTRKEEKEKTCENQSSMNHMQFRWMIWMDENWWNHLFLKKKNARVAESATLVWNRSCSSTSLIEHLKNHHKSTIKRNIHKSIYGLWWVYGLYMELRRSTYQWIQIHHRSDNHWEISCGWMIRGTCEWSSQGSFLTELKRDSEQWMPKARMNIYILYIIYTKGTHQNHICNLVWSHPPEQKNNSSNIQPGL